ncbi:hypothetical protein SLEP1_g24014 [Rubroshorea leprosula]|uniref:Uncharacterized protein n=1 Tax=Rubroshorea leprosula TaxID=152421 RepID=A0AAV5JMY9_9ROSI|nr:hypothetical protein SLEP1_g24014 [Rubroshorea leprosula]
MLGSRNLDLGSVRNPVAGFVELRSGFHKEPNCWVRRIQLLGSLLAGFKEPSFCYIEALNHFFHFLIGFDL